MMKLNRSLPVTLPQLVWPLEGNISLMPWFELWHYSSVWAPLKLDCDSALLLSFWHWTLEGHRGSCFPCLCLTGLMETKPSWPLTLVFCECVGAFSSSSVQKPYDCFSASLGWLALWSVSHRTVNHTTRWHLTKPSTWRRLVEGGIWWRRAECFILGRRGKCLCVYVVSHRDERKMAVYMSVFCVSCRWRPKTSTILVKHNRTLVLLACWPLQVGIRAWPPHITSAEIFGEDFSEWSASVEDYNPRKWIHVVEKFPKKLQTCQKQNVDIECLLCFWFHVDDYFFRHRGSFLLLLIDSADTSMNVLLTRSALSFRVSTHQLASTFNLMILWTKDFWSKPQKEPVAVYEAAIGTCDELPSLTFSVLSIFPHKHFMMWFSEKNSKAGQKRWLVNPQRLYI